MRPPFAPLVAAALLALSPAASAFCGFYAAGAGAKVFNNATMVVLFRDGTRTVLSMQNNYQGPPEGFAMVVPVPIVLQKENVKTLPREIFDRIDQLAAPRLVEYWEQDPCGFKDGVLRPGAAGGGGLGFGSGHGRLGGSHQVVVEAQFTVAEYEIVILSAAESGGLDAWLREHGYHIPEGAEPVLRPYVESGMFFFVARVDPTKVRFENGMATLSPLRFHYDSPTFTLPVRLGLLNSAGTQDLIVHIIARHQRYEVANYPNATIPTNLDVTDRTKDEFGAFYATLFDKTVAEGKGAVVTEYAWDAGSCDPCPVPALDAKEVATLGGDVVAHEGAPQVRLGEARLSPAGLPAEVVTRIVRQNLGRVSNCFEKAYTGAHPTLGSEVTMSFTIGKTGEVSKVGFEPPGPPADKSLDVCLTSAFNALEFPMPERAPLTVKVPLLLKPGSPSPRGLVLTRLHVRYGKDALGQDLVFREAPPITGGRERWTGGKLETGASPGEVSNFQARYAIRHPWEGPITCDKPLRGIWGARPAGDAGTAPESKPIAARNLAFAPRKGIPLDDFIPSAAAAEPPKGDAGPAAPEPAPPARKACSACQVGSDASGSGAALATALAAAAVGASRRRRGARRF